jgi:hypothetical protein
MSRKKDDPFLVEGLSRYSQAWATLSYFQDQVESLLKRVVESRRSWGAFKLAGQGKAISTNHGDSGRPEEPWISALVTGSVGKHAVRLDVGLWWNAPKADHPLICYVCFHDAPKQLTHWDMAGAPARIESYTRGDWTVMYVKCSGSSDIEGDLELLLEEFVARLQRVAKAA